MCRGTSINDLTKERLRYVIVSLCTIREREIPDNLEKDTKSELIKMAKALRTGLPMKFLDHNGYPQTLSWAVLNHISIKTMFEIKRQFKQRSLNEEA